MQFEFSTANRIIFGPGKLNSIVDLVNEFGKRVLIASGSPDVITDRLRTLLNIPGMAISLTKISHEPTVRAICELVELIQKQKPDLIIGIGGGSAIDSAKASSVLAANPGEVLDYLEVIGQNRPLLQPGKPVMAIPTTSGTGAEVTRNAVIGDPAQRVKVSLRSSFLLPIIVLIDPELMLSVPPTVTAYTGLDTLTQLIEPFTCNSPNPMTDALCLEGIKHVRRSLRVAYDDGYNLQAREEMALASLFSGICLANAKLGAVHGFAGPLGGELGAPHGAICASLLPAVMETNLKVLRVGDSDHSAIDRYTTIGKLLSGDETASADAGIEWVRDFCQHAAIPGLSAYGFNEAMFDMTVEKAINSSSMKGNPVILSADKLRNILWNAM
ncbi:MAG: iron-containing alcohol dehydrogenase [Acidobacteriaceae bacterium]